MVSNNNNNNTLTSKAP